jgi:hypothetical protein
LDNAGALALARLAAAGLALAMFWASAVSAQNGPVPPCAGPAYPDYAPVGTLLSQLAWIEDEVPADWVPPACTGWSAGPALALLAGAGRFRMAGDSAVIAARLASISGLTDMRYWSTTRSRWRRLFDVAVALSGPDRQLQRSDFAAGQLVTGAEVHFWLEEDNPTSGVVYRMLVHARTPDRIVFETVNVTSLEARLLLFRRHVAPPGEFRQLYFVEREAGDVWRYYAVIRMGRAETLAGTTAANFRNRAEAYFRYLAGLDMTREPPAAR